MPEANLPVIFGTAWLVGLSGAVSPGPVLALAVRDSVRHGPWAGPAIAFGHALLELILVILLYAGLGHFLTSRNTEIGVGILGGLFLFYMGWSMVRNRATGSPALLVVTVRRTGPGWRSVMNGALVSLANPFFTIWWATIGVMYLVWARDWGLWGLAAFYFGHILSDFAWYTVVSIFIGSGRRLLTDRTYTFIMVGCGGFLGLMGGYFLTRSARFLLG